MRFHLPALPGQPVTRDNSTCAFTQKVRKFANMMVPRGHEVFIYGGGECDANVTEYIECYPEMEAPPPFLPEVWEPFNTLAMAEIIQRAEPDDFLGLMAGLCQESLCDLPMIAVEYGIGYGGSFAQFRVFESYAWMHETYGQQQGTNAARGNMYDAAIPAYFEVDEFEVKVKEDYVLFVGRMTEDKGVHVAAAAAERAGVPIIFCGEGPEVPEYGTHLGHAPPDMRNDLMARARALFAPSLYIEPFGCVAVEAQLCGTPAITTDFGAYTETVEDGFSGFRCHTLREFADAIEKAGSLSPEAIRQRAVRLYSLEAVGPQYERYFNNLVGLRSPAGWYG